MKTNVFLAITTRIVILFVVAMFATFLPDLLRDFFGDTPHNCVIQCRDHCHNALDAFEPNWDWGIRHYWFFWMMVLLFLTSLGNVIIGIVNAVKKNYDI